MKLDRDRVARKVRDLRLARKWTQGELAEQLGLSQSRLSEIERGDGSFTAEQFLHILRLFNVTTDHFVAAPLLPNDAVLQNTLARLGAAHLRESDADVPSDRLRDADVVVREVLLVPESPRLVTALAPVLVQNVDRLNLNKLWLQLADAGLAQRLGWLLDNTIEAIRTDIQGARPKRQRQYRRTELVLQEFLDRVRASGPARERALDVFDVDIRTKKTMAEVTTTASPVSQRWRLVTAIQPADFVEALRGARVSD